MRHGSVGHIINPAGYNTAYLQNKVTVITLLSDSLNNPNGDINGRSITTGSAATKTWSTANGSIVISGAPTGSATMTTDTTDGSMWTSAIADCGQSNVTVQATINIDSTGLTALIARAADSSNFWTLELRNQNGTNTFGIWEWTAGAGANRNGVNLGSATTGNHTITLVCSATSLKGYLDGVLKTSFTSSSKQSNTMVGFTAFQATGSDAPGTTANWSVTAP